MTAPNPRRATATDGHVVRAISGLLLAVFVVSLSGTVVATALPRIIAELGGSQRQYTWVITATLLTITASGPIWGKLADRTSRRTLVQLAFSIFALGSVLAGFSPNTEILILFRAIEGVGMGGLGSLIPTVIASLVGPRERGRYVGYFVAVGAVATVGGPLVGGLIVDVPLLGWRWCFWIVAPIAVAALVLLRRTPELAVVHPGSRLDWLGVFLVPSAICILMIWVTSAGADFGWKSRISFGLVAVSATLIVCGVLVERRAADPLLPLRLLRNRTMLIALFAISVAGASLVVSSVFLAQYFQIARRYSPTESGLLLLPLLAAVVGATLVCGRLTSRTGRVKPPLVIGGALSVVGFALLGRVDDSTSLESLCLSMTILGLGIGSCVPNLVVVAQNLLDYPDLGAGTSLLTFFQSFGGAAGISVLGAVFASQVAGWKSDHAGIEHAYGAASGRVFLICAALAGAAFVAVLFVRESPVTAETVRPGRCRP
ncbi:MFS transporter [Jiangella anatolica]|uniref:EmrB/QacA family drug resistance transporter n=1 Tax=Jiangella anatolica TaxID=2670374 RepID=A0A2W2BAZ3_9ACTN|nr:MFS transporter [Jiangella anatolica]PZF82420.1 EmrB/QacA family drug resistance transporter [Jiangella anatolica]